MAILNTYLDRTNALLQLPEANNALYNTDSLISFINVARGQLAAEGECIRFIGTIPTVIGQRAYDFSDIDLDLATNTGFQAPIHVRRINRAIGDGGQQQLFPRPWEWFDLYCMSTVVPIPGPPKRWAQYGQGAAPGADGETGPGGSFYIDPVPDLVYTLYCDCVIYPAALDNTEESPPESLPYLWTDAVPYYAAYLALMSAQSNARVADAERLFNQYDMFVKRARQFSNPSLLRSQYQQSVDPAQINKLGVRTLPQGGG